MTNNSIEHLGIVESVRENQLSVRIVQTSLCASCHAKGYCSSADKQDKLIDVNDADAASYRVGERVMLIGETSMGVMAVALAFFFPFVLLVVALFLFMSRTGSELLSALLSLGVLVPYYVLLWLNKARLKKRFSFRVKPINN